MRRRLTRHPGIALLLLALLLTPFVAACGSGGDDSSGVATLDDSGADDEESDDSDSGDGMDTAGGREDLEEQGLEFAQCMRENGVPDFPDPQVDGGRIIMGGGPGGETGDLDQQAVEEAMKACEDLAPRGGGNFSEEDRQEMQDAALAHAQCMRENGVPDFPDPQFSEGGAAINLDDIDPESPAFKEAQEACEDKLPNRLGGEG